MKTKIKTRSDIDILIMIDTEYVKETYPQPSKDPIAPTGIGHNSQFMICTGYHQAALNEGAPSLNFSGSLGNRISLKASTVYDSNRENVIIYGISYANGGQLYNNFLPGILSGDANTLPETSSLTNSFSANKAINFTSCDTRERKKGLEKFLVYFALYRWDSSHINQELVGYYYWDPALNVA